MPRAKRNSPHCDTLYHTHTQASALVLHRFRVFVECSWIRRVFGVLLCVVRDGGEHSPQQSAPGSADALSLCIRFGVIFFKN